VAGYKRKDEEKNTDIRQEQVRRTKPCTQNDDVSYNGASTRIE
jgi:hypothetical protein